jgi:lysozyme
MRWTVSGKARLAALVGIPAAVALLTLIPEEESGRKVAVKIAPNGEATVRHVSGKQYLEAYLDIAKVPTACDGITRGVRMGQTYTEDQCAALLEQELVIHTKGVLNCTPGLNAAKRDNQRVAAISFAYNVGVQAYCGSSVARRFNAGNWRGGCDALLMWDKARVGGTLRPVKGLTRRREKERQICLRGLA